MAPRLTAVSLPDLFIPPKGTEFAGGLWATHDLDGAVLSDTIVPLLCGVTSRSPHRRRVESRRFFANAASARDDFGLVVLASSGHTLRSGPSLPNSVHVVEVGGRRQHAKFGILWFERPGGSHVTRLVVTSANLTRSGLGNNFEVCWSRDFERAKYEKAIVSYLLAQSQIILEDSSPGEALDLVKMWRRWWHRRTPSPADKVRRPKTIYSTLTEQAALIGHSAFADSEQVVIVSPAFQGEDSTTAAETLAHWVKKAAKVDIYTGPGNNGSVYFSGAIIEAIDDTGARLTLRSVSTASQGHEKTDEPQSPPRHRRLHAKLFASVSGSRARVFIGSANLTDRGLDGRNRELMIEVELPTLELQRFLSELPTHEVARSDLTPPPPNPPEGEEPAGELTAIFEIVIGSAESTRWRGSLELLLGPGVGPTDIAYLGKSLAPIFNKDGAALVEDFPLAESAASLDVLWPNGVSSRVAVIVRAPEGHPDFWSRVQPEGRGPRKPDLLNLLADLSRAVGISQGAQSSQGRNNIKEGMARDGYYTPPDGRLIALVRARENLHDDVSGDRLLEALELYFHDSHEIERECATAVLGAFIPDVEVPEHPLLQAFASAAAQIPTDSDS